MSWGTCYSGSNNIHYDFPAIMNDGRNYANWLPGAAINEQIRKDAGISTNWQYRRYLTEKADTIIRNNQVAACDECCALPRETYGNNTNEVPQGQTQPVLNRQMYVQPQVPYLYKSCADNTRPRYGYEGSDLKDMYTSKIQLQSRMITPVITQDQLLKHGFAHPN